MSIWAITMCVRLCARYVAMGIGEVCEMGHNYVRAPLCRYVAMGIGEVCEIISVSLFVHSWAAVCQFVHTGRSKLLGGRVGPYSNGI